jgi:retron-type reverse transcriptase
MGKILFDERKQRVVINGRESSCNNANADGPQGPILDPLLFIFFINEIENKTTNIYLQNITQKNN